MKPIFVSADIAALVAAFPPPSPSQDRAALVRSRSGNRLYSSSSVLLRFQQLLEASPSRMEFSELPSRLDIDKADWLPSNYNDALLSSCDGQHFVLAKEAENIVKQLFDISDSRVLDPEDFAQQQDVTKQSLNDLLNPYIDDGRLLKWRDDSSNGKLFLYSNVFAETVRSRLRDQTPADWTEGVDLNQHFASTPATLLLDLAMSFQDDRDRAEGSWQLLHGRCVFIAASYGESLERKKREALNAQAEELADQLATKGWCRVPKSGTNSQSFDYLHKVMNAYCQRGDTENIDDIPIKDEDTRLMVQSPKFSTSMETLRIAAPQEAARVWHARDTHDLSALKQATLRSLQDEVNHELHRLILRTHFADELVEIASTRLLELERQDEDSFRLIVQERLIALVQLHVCGIAVVADDTLKQHLEEYVGDYFRREIVPEVYAALEKDNYLMEKSRKRDVSKMRERCADAKTLSDVQSAVSKFAKKQDIATPSPEQLQRVTYQILQQKAKALRKIPRGSDVLQNLIWILLARETDGLFISAGKDTTRMVKLYQSVGEAEIAKKLEGWRDALKAGKEDAEMVREMKEMALRTIDDICNQAI